MLTRTSYGHRDGWKSSRAFCRLITAMLGGVLCLVSAHRAAGQPASRQLELSALPVGTPLRVTCDLQSAQAHWCYGSFRSVVGDTLHFAARGDATHSIVLAASQVVEANPSRRWSRRSHVILGGLLGAVLGAGIAYGPARNADSNCSTNGIPCGLGSPRVPLTIGAGLLGGIIAGAVWPAAHWERVSVVR